MMRIKLFAKKFEEMTAWAHYPEDKVKGFIMLDLLINKHVVFTFQVKVMNKTFSSRNPFKALLFALESESVGMAKYDSLKQRVRSKDLWKSL